jgi:hypothetical protein
VERIGSGLASLAFSLAEAAVRGGALAWVERSAGLFAGAGPGTLLWVGGFAAVGVPLALWTLLRLARTPAPVAHA